MWAWSLCSPINTHYTLRTESFTLWAKQHTKPHSRSYPISLSGTAKPVLLCNVCFSGHSSHWKEVLIFFSRLPFNTSFHGNQSKTPLWMDLYIKWDKLLKRMKRILQTKFFFRKNRLKCGFLSKMVERNQYLQKEERGVLNHWRPTTYTVLLLKRKHNWVSWNWKLKNFKILLKWNISF